MTLKERVDRLENIVKTQDENLVKLLENLPMIIENILKEKDQKGMQIIDPHQNFPSSSLFFKKVDYFVDRDISFLERYDLRCVTKF